MRSREHRNDIGVTKAGDNEGGFDTDASTGTGPGPGGPRQPELAEGSESNEMGRDQSGIATSSTWSRIIDTDVKLTKQLALCASPDSTLGFFRPGMKFLEWSCHGLPWLVGTFAAIIASHQISIHEKLMNLFSVFLVDLIIVGLMKFATQRQRPQHNQMDMFGCVSIDKLSFPSGHATRAATTACFFTIHFSLGLLASVLMIVWAVMVSLSRILLGRHHVLDVLGGNIIGVLQYFLFVKYLWLSPETCEAIILPVQEELHL